jgi:hypothetical protein
MKTKGRKHTSHPGLYAKRKVHSLLLNRKAASVVLSTVVLTAGVIAMSIAVLYWTYGMGKISRIEYTKSTTTSMSAINERIGFEYVRYLGTTLTVNIINCGKTDSINITRVYIMNGNYQNVVVSGLGVTLYNIDNPGTQLPGNKLGIGKEGYFTINTPNPLANGLYYVRITTGRGRNFDGSFAVS